MGRVDYSLVSRFLREQRQNDEARLQLNRPVELVLARRGRVVELRSAPPRPR